MLVNLFVLIQFLINRPKSHWNPLVARALSNTLFSSRYVVTKSFVYTAPGQWGLKIVHVCPYLGCLGLICVASRFLHGPTHHIKIKYNRVFCCIALFFPYCIFCFFSYVLVVLSYLYGCFSSRFIADVTIKY